MLVVSRYPRDDGEDTREEKDLVRRLVFDTVCYVVSCGGDLVE